MHILTTAHLITPSLSVSLTHTHSHHHLGKPLAVSGSTYRRSTLPQSAQSPWSACPSHSTITAILHHCGCELVCMSGRVCVFVYGHASVYVYYRAVQWDVNAKGGGGITFKWATVEWNIPMTSLVQVLIVAWMCTSCVCVCVAFNMHFVCLHSSYTFTMLMT